jgi:putative transposase
MKYKRAYKYRFYPTDEQKSLLARTFGCARYIYNWGLRKRTDAYYKQGTRLYYDDLSAQLTELKKQDDHSWLNEVSAVPLQQSLRHLDRAFVNFFEGRASYPTFKNKHGPQAATYASNAFTWDGQRLTLAKMEKPLDIHWSRPLPQGYKPTTVTVSKDCADRYFVSLLIEEEMDSRPVVNQQVGLDLGLTSMVVLSTGEAVGNPRYFHRDEKKLARAQRRLSKKKKGSRNRERAHRLVARIHAQIADRRRDSQHKLSTRIVNENQVICVESLAVKNMVKNPKLAKAIHDVGWGEFVRQLEYKSQWSGRTFVKIDKWYPSSKRCFACGHVVEELPLEIRVWTCPECGVVHERDHNAANNVLAAGLAVSACGEAVRPGAVKATSGKPRRSRKASSREEASPGFIRGEDVN